MQRQSLGSPGSKLHSHGVVSAKEENLTNRPFSLTTHQDNEKSQKTTPPQKTPERLFIHIIPVLTLLCFLILYLCSHDPTSKDLAQFNGFTRSSKPIDSTEIDDFGQILDMERSDVLAIRSLRNLQEINRHDPKHRLPRKIGDF